MQADSLMQMGRWFRIPAQVPRPRPASLWRAGGGQGTPGRQVYTTSIYEPSETSCGTGGLPRALEVFSQVEEDGVGGEPIDIPPLVFRQLPWLRPTSRTRCTTPAGSSTTPGSADSNLRTRGGPEQGQRLCQHRALRPQPSLAPETGRFQTSGGLRVG